MQRSKKRRTLAAALDGTAMAPASTGVLGLRRLSSLRGERVLRLDADDLLLGVLQLPVGLHLGEFRLISRLQLGRRAAQRRRALLVGGEEAMVSEPYIRIRNPI